jgi:hypothetical protein
MAQTLLYQYGNTTYDLGELPDSLYDRLCDKGVTEALHAYLEAHDADKSALEAYEAYDEHVWPTETDVASQWKNSGQLLRNYTLARKTRKKKWEALVVLLDE